MSSKWSAPFLFGLLFKTYFGEGGNGEGGYGEEERLFPTITLAGLLSCSHFTQVHPKIFSGSGSLMFGTFIPALYSPVLSKSMICFSLSPSVAPKGEEQSCADKCDLSNYLRDPDFKYKDFAKRGVESKLPTFRAQVSTNKLTDRQSHRQFVTFCSIIVVYRQVDTFLPLTSSWRCIS